MDRKKNMHNNNQKRQISSTGAVPKTSSKRETSRDVVSRVVAPIVRETPHNNITSYNMLLDWQQNQYPEQHTYDHSSHQRERFNRDLTSSGENTAFEQVVNVNGGVLPHEQQNWLQVRPQIRKRNQMQSGTNNSKHNMSNANGLQQPQPHHSSSNTAIVLPTTPNMHPLTNGDLILSSNSNNDMFMPPRHQDRATQVLPLINNNRAESDDRLNNGQAFMDASTNMPSGCEGSSVDESNDLNAPMLNSENMDDSMRCLEMQLRMDISNRKLQAMQYQHSQLLLIQESAKMQLEKLRRHKQMEQQVERSNQSQQQTNQTNKVFSVQSSQQFDNSNQSDRNSATKQIHNQTDFSFQPINPMSYSLQNNENMLNQNHNENQIYNRENTNYNCYSDNRANNQTDNKSKLNGHSSITSIDASSENNHLIPANASDNPGDFSRLDDGLMNISRRLMAVDALMETRSEVEDLANLTLLSAQGDYEEKLRELQSKKQQMDSLVADLQQLNKQANRDAEMRASINAVNEIDLLDAEAGASVVQEESLPVPNTNTTTTEGSTSSVGNEVAQINAMKVQLARLKDMMDTMKYIEARTGGSDDSVRSSSPHSSICDHQSASTIETTNYAESWASSTMKPNNVDHMGQIPYKALLSDNENLNSVSNWLVSEGADRSNKYSESSPLVNNTSLGGLSVQTVQSLSQELREQANALTAERDRLVQAQNQILSRSARSASMSSCNSYGNRPEKCVNQQATNRHLHKHQLSSQEPGPKERQQQMLKAQLDAKKRELEELMKKDRDLSAQINQTASTSSAVIKQDAQSEANSSSWPNEQNGSRFQNKPTARKLSGPSGNLSDVESQRASRRSRDGSESTVITSLPDIDISSNADYNQQMQNIPLRNSSRHSNNTTPPVPPPMPDINFRKDSQDSSSYTSPSSQNNQSNSQNQFNWQPRLAQQLQAQFDMYFNHCQNLAMAAAAANNQTQMSNANPPMLPPFIQQPISSFPNPPVPHSAELGLCYQLFNPPPLVPQTGFGNNFGPYCPCNNALWQIVWMQQREIANFGRAVCLLQEHLLQITSKPLAQQPSDTNTNQSISQRAQPSASASSVAPSANPINNVPQLTQHNQQMKLPQNNVTNLVSNQSSIWPSSGAQHIQQVFENETIFNRGSLNLGNINNLASDQSVNLSAINFVTPSLENLQYIHNNTTGQDLGASSQNLNLQNHGQIYRSGDICIGSVPNSATGQTTLNNQVPPGNRANNYWDNFRSYSRQNLLSGNSKTAKESTSSATTQSGPSPLVIRSHNALRTVPTCPPSLPKQNTQMPSELQFNNFIQDQANVNDVNIMQRQMQSSVRNQSLEIQPDVLNVNQTQVSLSGTNTPQQDLASGNNLSNANSILSNIHIGSSANYPEIIQTHSSFADIAQQNLKTNLPVKSSGTNKKKSKISVVRSINNETDNNQQQSHCDAKHDPNLLSSQNLVAHPKSTIKPFDQLREAVYGEVTALIAQNESRPQYLLQLFQNLRQVGCDPLRQQALNEIQNLVSTETSSVTNNGSSAVLVNTSASSAATNTSDNSKTPSKNSGKYTGAVKKGNISVRKEEQEPTASQAHFIAESSSATDGNDQRCSSTTDAEQSNIQISNENSHSAVFGNGFLEELNASCMDVSCSDQFDHASFDVSHTERNNDTSKSTPRFSENLVSSLSNIHLSEENNGDLNNLILNAMPPMSNMENVAIQNSMATASNESQNLYRANSAADNALPCNEDLAEADQIRISGTRNDATTSTQTIPVDALHANRNMSEKERSGDTQAQGTSSNSSRQESEINMVNPLPDLARVGPGGDHDVPESNRLVMLSGFDHGLDRVPTRLSNGPWSPESSANESNLETSIHSNVED